MVREVIATETLQVEALEAGRAFAELPGWRTFVVRGRDARRWLHDLITTDVQGLRSGQARRSLVLTPTGRIRADFQVVADGESFLLLQAGDQPTALDRILAPYVLSSDVTIEDLTERRALFAVLGGSAAEDGDASVSVPSVLGSGANLVVPTGPPARRLRDRLVRAGFVAVSPASLDAWRIRRGDPRMGVDFGEDSLPAEVGLEGTIDLTKGCFLGQESVAKVRNLGHPPRILLQVRSGSPLHRGATVFAEGSPVGEITSVAAVGDGSEAIVRVRWEATGRDLSTETGPLLLRWKR